MKIKRALITLSLFASMMVGAFAFAGDITATVTKADSAEYYPGSGFSGSTVYVNGRGTYFKSGEADLAVCFWDTNSSAYAWTPRLTERVSGDIIRVILPTYQGNSKQWNRFKVCRYIPSMNPQESGDLGIYNCTADIDFSFVYGQNTIEITGYGDPYLSYTRNHFTQYGVRGEKHMYLDLSNFTSWEEGNAKFAIWFAASSNNSGSSWGQCYAGGTYYSSFCWKVEGQDNPHLYECVVPNTGTENNRNIWSMVIAVRIDPIAGEPNWDNKWNQTQNLTYNSSNENANMIRITDWGTGEIDNENIISEDSRLSFYGNYFLSTVSCSGTGNSDATTSQMWAAVETAYGHLSRILQGEVWKAVADEEGTEIQKAMARYDYIVLYKQYQHNDFINRAESPNKTAYANIGVIQQYVDSDSQMYIIITIIAVVSALALTSLIILKKHRSH